MGPNQYSAQHLDPLSAIGFNNLSRIDILYYIFLILFYGDLNKSKKITKIISKNIKISSLDKINVQCDGEKYGTLPVEINYKSETVRLIS